MENHRGSAPFFFAEIERESILSEDSAWTYPQIVDKKPFSMDNYSFSEGYAQGDP